MQSFKQFLEGYGERSLPKPYTNISYSYEETEVEEIHTYEFTTDSWINDDKSEVLNGVSVVIRFYRSDKSIKENKYNFPMSMRVNDEFVPMTSMPKEIRMKIISTRIEILKNLFPQNIKSRMTDNKITLTLLSSPALTKGNNLIRNIKGFKDAGYDVKAEGYGSNTLIIAQREISK